MQSPPVRRRLLPAALAGLAVVIAGGCGVAAARTPTPSPKKGSTLTGATTEPAACRGLTTVRVAHVSSIPQPTGPIMFPAGENFDTWTPGAPYLVGTLDDSGLHFAPSHVVGGVYNVCFVDARTHRTHPTDVVLDFYLDAGPIITDFSVNSGTIGAGRLCPVATVPGVTVGGIPFGLDQDSGSLSISYAAGCPTVIS